MELATLNGNQRRKCLAILLTALVLGACNDDKLPNVATASGLNPAISTIAPVAPAQSTPPAQTRPPATSTPAATPPVAALPMPPAATPPADEDALPQISGAPKTQAEVNAAYSFVPSASDPDGDKLSFTIANRPGWLSFASATGALTGRPTAAHVGVYKNITIQVEAAGQHETLPSFDIEVVAVGQQGVTLSWNPPTQNADGSPLNNLAGYKIRYGEAPGIYTTTIPLSNPGLASHFIEGLVPSTYYFVISSYNSQGIESNYSNEVSKTI